MPVFLVFVRSFSDGRYVDSVWVKKDHAIQRVKELSESIEHGGHLVGGDHRWQVWWGQATVSDAVLGVQE